MNQSLNRFFVSEYSRTQSQSLIGIVPVRSLNRFFVSEYSRTVSGGPMAGFLINASQSLLRQRILPDVAEALASWEFGVVSIASSSANTPGRHLDGYREVSQLE